MFESLLSTLKETSNLIDDKINKLLPLDSNSKVISAMRYSVLSPGKRIRPFLTLTCSKLFGIETESALQIASAIEMIHAYSLIHDDLPAIDNDNLRRGQDSCHIKFDEATAILAGDGLLTFAFEILADNSIHSDGNIRAELIGQIARAIGVNGMIGGQELDILYKNQNYTINDIIRTHRMKTGALFTISAEAAAIVGRASKNSHLALRGYAQSLGLAFQIIDDIKDNRKDEASFVSVMGINGAKEQASILVEQAIIHIDVFDHRADLLRDLARYIIRSI